MGPSYHSGEEVSRRRGRRDDRQSGPKATNVNTATAMIFSLDVRRARKGDCLILHYGTKVKPGLVLIDGGPAQVYGPQLKPRLEEIRKARRLAEGEPLTVDLLMVSQSMTTTSMESLN